MGAFSVWHWLAVVAVLMIFFGRGRISGLMADVGKGVGNLRRELAPGSEPAILPAETGAEATRPADRVRV